MVFTIKYDRVGIRNHAILSKFEDFLLRMLLSIFSNYAPVQVHLQGLGDSTMHFWTEKSDRDPLSCSAPCQNPNQQNSDQMTTRRDYLPMMYSKHSDVYMTFGDFLSLRCTIHLYCPSSTIPAFNNCKVHLFISILVRFIYLGLRLSCFSWPQYTSCTTSLPFCQKTIKSFMAVS